MLKGYPFAVKKNCVLGVLVGLCVAGCGGSDSAANKGVLKPKEAATQLQQAFTSAPQDAQQSANAASEALRNANYDQALQSLNSITVRKDLTHEQGMAVHESMVALEARLISEAEGGNAKAKATYEMLKRSRRN